VSIPPITKTVVAAEAYHRATMHHIRVQDELADAKAGLKEAQEEFDLKTKKLADAKERERECWEDLVIARSMAYPEVPRPLEELIGEPLCCPTGCNPTNCTKGK
jgi:hypothetical protein